MRKIFVLFCLCFAFSSLSAQNKMDMLRNQGFNNECDAIGQICMSYASKQIPLDQEYMYWLIKWHEFIGESTPSMFLLGAAYVNGLPAIKVERNYQKALFYYQYYDMFRPALEEENGYHWWEEPATLEKLNSLWDKGYVPEPGNEGKGLITILPETIKVSNSNVQKGETEYLSFSIKNDGSGDIDFALAIAKIASGSVSIDIPTVSIPIIKPGVTVPIIIPFTIGKDINSGPKTIIFKISDPRGSDTESKTITIHAR